MSSQEEREPACVYVCACRKMRTRQQDKSDTHAHTCWTRHIQTSQDLAAGGGGSGREVVKGLDQHDVTAIVEEAEEQEEEGVDNKSGGGRTTLQLL